MYIRKVDVSGETIDKKRVNELSEQVDEGELSLAEGCVVYHNDEIRRITDMPLLTVPDTSIVLEIMVDGARMGYFTTDECIGQYHMKMLKIKATRWEDFETPLVTQAKVALEVLEEFVAGGLVTFNWACTRYNEIMSRSDNDTINIYRCNHNRYETLKTMDEKQALQVLRNHFNELKDMDACIDVMSN